MKISSLFKAEMKERIVALHATLRKRRPLKINIDEAIDCLFRLVRTGMQWREVEITSVTYSSMFKHVKRWVDHNIRAIIRSPIPLKGHYGVSAVFGIFEFRNSFLDSEYPLLNDNEPKTTPATRIALRCVCRGVQRLQR